MTRDDYRAAISRFEPDAALKERIVANLELTPCRKARPSMRRVLTGVLAAVIVLASLTGVLRGLIREGYPVTRGLKIADIDPRLEQVAYCDTVSDKARAIGGGVVEALLAAGEQKGVSLL